MHAVASSSVSHHALRAVSALVGLASAAPAFAAIPASERAVLVALYQQAGGANWTHHIGWNGVVGTECSWSGVVCNGAQTHVTGLALQSNHLVGTLPPLQDLAELENANFDTNELSGPIPPLAALVHLVSFGAEDNQLTGALPTLDGLVHLQELSVAYNGLSGPIPALSTVVQLRHLFLHANHFSGPIPALTGLSHLEIFNAQDNQLTAIGAVAGLGNLVYFLVDNNLIHGQIPALTGLSSLGLLSASNNHIEGPLPALTGLVHLSGLVLDHNAITGPLPSLAGLDTLNDVVLDHNAMSGQIPAPPAPMNHLVGGISTLCPNGFIASSNAGTNTAWDVATGTSPWNQDCNPDRIFASGFDEG